MGYGFSYDGANRLVNANYKEYVSGNWSLTNKYSEKSLQYDANGNILSLTRHLNSSTGSALNYTYDANKPNRLNSVLGLISATYQYDYNGNMTNDNTKGAFAYDYRNMPIKVTTNDTVIEYAYDAAGQRIKKKFRLNGVLLDSVIYVRNGSNVLAEYRNSSLDHYNIYGNGLIGKLVPTPKAVTVSQTVSGQTITAKDTVYIVAGGRINSETMVAAVGNGSTSDKRYYYLLDHLGSIRVVLKEDGNVESWSDYYPFGKESRSGYSQNTPKEKYTGKERDIEIGLDYFGARYYNADIGRWTTKDPLAEKYPSLSPYHYSNNNPILFVDFDGRDFGVKVDHDARTITFTAKYYVPHDGTSAGIASNALSEWNNFSGTYKTQDGIDYSVSIELEVENSSNSRSHLEDARSDPIGNSFEAQSDNVFYTYHMNGVGGYTEKRENIQVPTETGNVNTQAHEVGHTFGLKDNSGNGVMVYPRGSFDNMKPVNTGDVKSFIRNGLNAFARFEKGKETPGIKILGVQGSYKGKNSFTSTGFFGLKPYNIKTEKKSKEE